MANTGNTTTKTKQANKQEHVGINVLVPSALHKRLRIKALNDGLSLSEAIEQAVKAWLR